ncbi:MAG: hypothetical protein JOS17DRAFT_748085 [Linnemannia elongata]|nr:MAG: hypothetical protein JOS17DRAFT_748085 [Linnemannia elongata]
MPSFLLLAFFPSSCLPSFLVLLFLPLLSQSTPKQNPPHSTYNTTSWVCRRLRRPPMKPNKKKQLVNPPLRSSHLFLLSPLQFSSPTPFYFHLFHSDDDRQITPPPVGIDCGNYGRTDTFI